MPGRRYIEALLTLALLATAPSACGGTGDDTVDFPTGDFVIETTLVDDTCLDGGLNLLFMPNGTSTPWEWPFPVTLHAEDELPVTYDIQLREPFGEMTVTAQDAGVNVQVIEAETNEGVLLGEARFGQCVADMDATVQIELVTTDGASGVAELTMTNPRGDERCPREMPESCEVLLTFEAARQ